MKLPKNESTLDRSIRIVFGIGLFIVALLWLTGAAQLVALAIASIAGITGLIDTCGIYMLCGNSTCPVKK